MVIKVTSNAKSVAASIAKSIRAAAAAPNKEPVVISRIISNGISNHFNRLAHGGTDATALNGPASWPRRSTLADAVRESKGLPRGGGLLTGRKLPGAALFPNAAATPIPSRNGSLLRFAPSNAGVGLLLSRHSEGKRPLPDGMSEKLFDPLPRRKVYYWDREMAADIKAFVRTQFRTSMGGVAR